MTPTQRSRRSLLGGIIAFVFGWLFAQKPPTLASGTIPVPIPEPLPATALAAGLLVDPVGFITTRVYDAMGNFLYQIEPPGPSTTFTYDGRAL